MNKPMQWLVGLFLTHQQKKKVKIARVRLFERLGLKTYSRPALHDMERKLLRYIKNTNGFYVECGANDGYSQSNTYYFWRFMGWRGILVEPVPYLYALCREFRPDDRVFNCALGADDGKELRLQYRDLCSKVTDRAGSGTPRDGNDIVVVRSRTLGALLDEAGTPTIDLLSLDVEGYELEVLKGVDLRKYEIKYILVESSRIREVQNMLLPTHQLIDQFSHHDYLFKHTSE